MKYPTVIPIRIRSLGRESYTFSDTPIDIAIMNESETQMLEKISFQDLNHLHNTLCLSEKLDRLIALLEKQK